MLKQIFARLAPRRHAEAARPLAAPSGSIVELPPVSPASLPASYAERQANAAGIEGMFSTFSMQIMDAVLAQQARMGCTGHILEFGVWRGRSACLLSGHVRDGERPVLCDIGQYLTEEVLGRLYVRPEFVLGSSAGFRHVMDLGPLRGRVRFAHVDSSHSYQDTLAEMRLVDELLAPDGVACLDDFANLNYSQILPAVFRYLSTTDTNLEFFLVSNDKGYLCRRAAFADYGAFVLGHLVDEVRARGTDNVMLARTDAQPEYRAFYVRQAAAGEAGPFFGEHLYEEFYRSP